MAGSPAVAEQAAGLAVAVVPVVVVVADGSAGDSRIGSLRSSGVGDGLPG